MSYTDKWPQLLRIARHGYTRANERKDKAKQAGQEPSWTDIERDQDTPLVPVGHQQAYDLGVMIGRSNDELPEVIITSPFYRAKQTTVNVVLGIQAVRPGYQPRIVIDERIREIEFGIMDGIDRATFRKLFPSEAARRERDGKYWYRAPGGENRPDVRLRVHSILDTINRDYVGMNVLIICHSVVVLAFRSLLERWDEQEYLQVDKEDDVKNCGLTIYDRVPGTHNPKLVLREYNVVAPPQDLIKIEVEV